MQAAVLGKRQAPAAAETFGLLEQILSAGCQAALFDLDGVITDTAVLHAQAWQQAFDELLHDLASSRACGDLAPFDLATEYPRHIDGRTRLEGIHTFLAARGIALPLGTEDDPPFASMLGLGRYKNALYHDALANVGIDLYADAVEFIRQLRQSSVKIGLATSSKNASHILGQTGIASLFDAVVDGNDVERQAMRSKPAADIFLHAAMLLRVSFSRCAVFEDSPEALAAAAALHPACAIGVNRKSPPVRKGQCATLTYIQHFTDRLDAP